MIPIELVTVAIVIVFFTGILIPLLLKDQKRLIVVPVWSSAIVFVLSVFFAIEHHLSGTYFLFGENFVVDQLAIYHIFLVNLVFLSTGIYMQDYFAKAEAKAGASVFHYRRFSMLWQAFQLMLLVVILSNNIGLIWVAMEATTVLSAFLIISESDSLSLEAMWKFLLVCSVGIGLAFIGTILIVAAGRDNLSSENMNTFSSLILSAENLNPQLLLFAFIFIAVGYGTKAGLAPMHTWLPDTYTQAPTPVASVSSGVMLNAALFVIMRYLPIVEASLGGSGEARSILLLLGFLSLLFAAVFIPIQHDLKRILAYCSVEHIGIIAIGLGLGGLGTIAALLHSLNHSISKMLAFFSAGSIIHSYGTRDMRRISGVMKRMPVWGSAFLVSMLALIGVAPFSVFFSEFMIVKTAFDKGHYLLFGLFMLGIIAVFISMLRHVLDMAFKTETGTSIKTERVKPSDKAVILLFVAALFLGGLWIPPKFIDFLKDTASVIETGIKL